MTLKGWIAAWIAVEGLSSLAFVQTPPISAAPLVTCGATCAGDHLQGMATDGESLYWGFGTEIIKTDLQGNKLASTGAVKYHHGDPCVVEGIVYAPANHGALNTETGNDDWVYAYRSSDMSFVRRWALTDTQYGVGGMTYYNGSFYVVCGSDETCSSNIVYQYDRDFQLVARHVLNTGYTYLGIQSVTYHDGLFYFGWYAKRTAVDPDGLDSTITATPDFKTLRRWFPGCPEGIVPLNGKLAFAIAPRMADGTFGGVLYPFETDEKREILWPSDRAMHDEGGVVNELVLGGGDVSMVYSDPIPPTITVVRKIGSGTVTISGKNVTFSCRNVFVEGGVLEMARRESLGSGNVINVASNAQLKMAFGYSGQFSGEGGLNRLVIAGDGPDGNGAVYVSNADAGSCDAFFGPIALGGTASIGLASSRGFGDMVDLCGHTLTIRGPRTVFGSTIFKDARHRSGARNGHIVLATRVAVLQGSPNFEGGPENTISLAMPSGGYLQLWNMEKSVPWRLIVNANSSESIARIEYGQSLSNGIYSTEVNDWSGPVELHADICVGSGSLTRRAGIFSGPIIDSGGCHALTCASDPVVKFSGTGTEFSGLFGVSGGDVTIGGGHWNMPGGSSTEWIVGGLDAPTSGSTLTIANALVETPVWPGYATPRLRVCDTGPVPAILNIMDGTVMTNTLLQAMNDGEKSSVHQFGGNVFNLARSGNDSYVARFGAGYYGLYGGRLDFRNFIAVAGGSGATGVFRQTGGAIHASGEQGILISRGGIGEYQMTGGSFRMDQSLRMGEMAYSPTKDSAGGMAVFSLYGGDPYVDIAGELDMCERTNGFTSVLNLNAGVFSAKTVRNMNTHARQSIVRSQSSVHVNFNGGTYRLNGAQSFFQGGASSPTAITVFEGGAVFDTAGFTNNEYGVYIGDCGVGGYGTSPDGNLVFRSPRGRGIKSITLPASAVRTGYAGTMPVSISGGGGEGATAALDYDPGTKTVTGITVTCPGWNYTSAPTVTIKAPDWTTDVVCNVELMETGQNAGPIVKAGEGILYWAAANMDDFSGMFVVSNGQLTIGAHLTIPASCGVRLAGGILRYDWKNRELARVGGYGRLYGFWGETNHTLTVSRELFFDAVDLNDGRFIEMPYGPLSLKPDVTVRIDNAELLDADKAPYTLMTLPNVLSKVPEGRGLPQLWRIGLANRGRILSLCRQGMVFSIR